MSLIKQILIVAAAGAVVVGCGSSDNTCTDAGCPDANLGGNLDASLGSARDANPNTITTGNYKATAVVPQTDDCKIDPKIVVDMMILIPVDLTGGVMKVGNPKGEPVAPSLGQGPLVTTGDTFKLTRMNHFKVGTDPVTGVMSPCEYDQEVTSTITLDAFDSFGLGVQEKQSNRTMCTAPAGVGASCTSTWSWRMVKVP